MSAPLPAAEAAGVARADSTSRAVAKVAVFTALIAALSVMPVLPLPLVPITLQTLAVTIAALLLGPALGTLAVAAWVALIAVGAPVANGGRGGLGVLLGPTGGYLLGFIVGAAVIGALGHLALRRLTGTARTLGLIGAGLAGLPFMYALGLWRLGAVTGLSGATLLQKGMWLFLPGDILKAVLAGVIVAGVVRALPTLIPAARAGARR